MRTGRSTEEIEINERSRVPLYILYGAIVATASLVAFACSLFYSIKGELHDIKANTSGLVASKDFENWILKARAANAQKFPDLVWPGPPTSDAAKDNPGIGVTAVIDGNLLTQKSP